MANRFQVNQHDLAYNFLAAYEGEYCLVGRISHKKCAGKLQIDHADNDPWNWKAGNIHLVCRKHNLELRKLTTKEHKAKMARYSAKNERERKKIKVIGVKKSLPTGRWSYSISMVSGLRRTLLTLELMLLVVTPRLPGVIWML